MSGKRATQVALAWSSFLLLGGLAAGAVEFAGLRTANGATQFILVDRESGKTSGWVGLDRTFEGFTIARFDAKREVLVLTKDGATAELRLRLPQIRSEAWFDAWAFPFAPNSLPTFDPALAGSERLRELLTLAQRENESLVAKHLAMEATDLDLVAARARVELLDAQWKGDPAAFDQALFRSALNFLHYAGARNDPKVTADQLTILRPARPGSGQASITSK